MTTQQTNKTHLETLIDAGSRMRASQREYFDARKRSDHKTAISMLPSLKRIEKEFDALLVSAKVSLEASLFISKSFDVLAEDPEAKP